MGIAQEIIDENETIESMESDARGQARRIEEDYDKDGAYYELSDGSVFVTDGRGYEAFKNAVMAEMPNS
jgi:hypothetical protein